MNKLDLTRGNLALLVVVLVLGVLRLATGSGGPEDSGADRDRAFAAFDPAAITRLTLARPGGDALHLARTKADAPWTVTDRLGFPALAFPIETLMAQVAGLTLADQVSEEASSHAIFGVDEGLALTLEAPGTAPWSFVLGHAGRESGGTTSYLRAAAEDRVFALGGAGSLTTAPRSWIDPSLVDLDVGAVARIEVTVAGQSVAIERDDKGRWSEELTGQQASRVDTEDLLGFASTLVLDDVVAGAPEAAAFGSDVFRIAFEPAAAEGAEPTEPWPVVLELGAQVEDGRWLVRSGAWARAERTDWCGYLPEALGVELRARVRGILTGIGQ